MYALKIIEEKKFGMRYAWDTYKLACVPKGEVK